MPLLARTVLAPLAVEIRSDAIDHLPTLLRETNIAPTGRVAVVAGTGIGHDLVADLNLPQATTHVIEAGDLSHARDLARLLKTSDIDALVALGGGRVIDTAKYAATELGTPLVAVATSLAHDGIASPVASLRNENGVSTSYGVHTPLAIAVDLDRVLRAPAVQRFSGIGDVLTNLSAVADWQLSHRHTAERYDGLAAALAYSGAEAVLRHPKGIDDPDFLYTLASALVQGGLAMGMAGSSRPCSGGCHEIAHAIEHLYPGSGSHGQQGALGALYCTWIRDDRQLWDDLVVAYRRHGLPTTPTELGLTPDRLTKAIAYAPATRPGRYTILEHRDMDTHEIRHHLDGMIDELG
ncbi:iron-containing alcohol dehydrogenase family protein [Haloglycomyces albus]|uniref:iron-containing alcohol dehydrogenase family protein n=1 Tax=Haloglycomyces albus TaxID=526067 RepID=UPI00046CE3C3|nr:iron-containing alcohol dehydrogenase family protein [Haloglycomyces albus]